MRLSLLASFLAAVVIAPSDETMIRTAPAVVTGTVVNVYTRHDDRGDIETVARVLVDEAIKGNVVAGQTIDVVQFGGWLDGRFQAQSGAPSYELGARYLVVLDRNGRGQWTTFDLALGQFRFLFRDGMQKLVRDTHDMSGWTESGAPFRDQDRPAQQFLAFVRDVARSAQAQGQVKLTPAPNALDFNLTAVVQSAVAAWAGAAPMNDSVSGSPAGGDTKSLGDCESRVIADDPHADIAGSCCPGIVGTAYFGCGCPPNPCATSMKNGESYLSIDQTDVVINDGTSSANISAGDFRSAMVHELGHTWGFRHSNQNGSNGSCAAPLPCDTNAIMNSNLVSGLNGTLQSYDKDAANEVYGDGSRQATFTGAQYVYPLGGKPSRRAAGTAWRIWQQACTAPSISAHPQNQTIISGQQANLTVTASGTATLSYQWYIGNPPSTATPAGSGQTIHPTPASTTTYWVRVTGQCGTPADSNPATVIVSAGCSKPFVVNDPSDQSIASGSSTSIFVGYSGTSSTVTWYRGTAPDQSNAVGSGQSFITGPLTQTTQFWALIANNCGSAQSRTVRIVVTTTPACVPPTITRISDDSTVSSNQTATLEVAAAGDPTLHYQWFQGPSGNTSTPVGTDSPTFLTPALFTDTEYWVRVSNACAPPASSRTVKVSVIPAKRRAARH
ncbi:MAG TPA: hypothetical protein VI670_23050 [Thermoanaerobaculia bacterium]